MSTFSVSALSSNFPDSKSSSHSRENSKVKDDPVIREKTLTGPEETRETGNSSENEVRKVSSTPNQKYNYQVNPDNHEVVVKIVDGEVVVKIIDGETGEEVKQIPPEEVIQLSQRVTRFNRENFEGFA